MKKDKVEVIINSDGCPVPIYQFTDYFFLLRACYALALEEAISEMIEMSYDDDDVAVDTSTTTEYTAHIIESILPSMSPDKLNELSNIVLSEEEELFIENITRKNPFEIIFSGIGIALVSALIISGGNFEIGLTKLKIEIPPLGTGITKLRKAFKIKE